MDEIKRLLNDLLAAIASHTSSIEAALNLIPGPAGEVIKVAADIGLEELKAHETATGAIHEHEPAPVVEAIGQDAKAQMP